MISGLRRWPCEICLEMLELSRTPKSKTRLINSIGIKYTKGLTYLAFLVDNEYIEKVSPPKMRRRTKNPNWRRFNYKITKKGQELMKQIVDGKHCVLFFDPSCSEEAKQDA